MAADRCDRIRRVWMAAVMAGLALFAGACALGGDGDEASGDRAESQAAGGSGGADEGRALALEPDGGGATTAAIADANASTLPGLGPTVIKKAYLELEVPHDEFQGAMQDASTIAADHGGYVLRTEVTDASEGFGTVVLRIPSEEFEAALVAAQGLGDIETNTL